jgi:hypothetical protein
LAREWRVKWSEENDKKSLASAQSTLVVFKSALSAIKGAKIQRIVCGSCHDFKVIVSLPTQQFIDWKTTGFAPEADFLAVFSLYFDQMPH